MNNLFIAFIASILLMMVVVSVQCTLTEEEFQALQKDESMSNSDQEAKEIVIPYRTHSKHCAHQYWAQFVDSDYYKSDILHINETTPKVCAEECQDMKGCMGFNYQKNMSRCDLKKYTKRNKWNIKLSIVYDFYFKLPCHHTFKEDCISENDPKGHSYKGHIDFAPSDVNLCMDWSKQNNYTAKELNADSMSEVKNYCRNPKSSNRDFPWCFVNKNNKIVQDTCRIEICERRTCLPFDDITGKNYGGQENRTKYNKDCMDWSKQTKYNLTNLNAKSWKEVKNYCRNPLNERKVPWCYVAPGEIEDCNIKKCVQVKKIETAMCKKQYWAEFVNLDYRFTDYKSHYYNITSNKCAKKCGYSKKCIGFNMYKDIKRCDRKKKTDIGYDNITRNMINFDFYFKLPCKIYVP